MSYLVVTTFDWPERSPWRHASELLGSFFWGEGGGFSYVQPMVNKKLLHHLTSEQIGTQAEYRKSGNNLSGITWSNDHATQFTLLHKSHFHE